MKTKIKIKTQLNATTFGKLSGHLNWQKLKPLAGLFVVVIAGLMVSQFVLYPFDEATVKVMGYLVPLGLIVLVWWGIMKFNNKKGFENNPLIGEPIVYTFDKKEIHIKGESFESKMSWDKLHRVEETADFILIYQTKMMANGLPKTQISETDLRNLRTLLQAIPNLECRLL